MKCIRCQNDCKYKERSNQRCPNCNGRFAFEPRTGDWTTDMQFQHAIEHVSSQGHLQWGVEHLYYELCRRQRWGPVGKFLVGLFADTRLARRTEENFNTMWKRWVDAHGKPAGVITRKNPLERKSPRLEEDIAHYSFDRVVICDRARTVDILLANNFHFENNCAILSHDGYPPGPFNTIRKMLLRNPRLQVFVLHDATPDGCQLATRLARDPEWFAGKIPVVDVGLRPGQATPLEGLFRRSQKRQVEPGEGLSVEEAKWLCRYRLELAAIRPEQILKRMFRALNRQYDPNESTKDGTVDRTPATDSSGDGGWFVISDSTSFGSDASDSGDGGDSFG